MKGKPYATLGLAIGVHFLIMWALTYSGVAVFDHIHLNWNRFYMAVIMVAPMTIIMVLAMRHMLTDTRRNIALVAVSAVVFVGGFAMLRAQTFVATRSCPAR